MLGIGVGLSKLENQVRAQLEDEPFHISPNQEEVFAIFTEWVTDWVAPYS